ncbi:MAG TPA: ATP-binding protein [Nitrospirota bacterium]|nr:ATP-binding protein [Nitrospirota bacterium]
MESEKERYLHTTITSLNQTWISNVLLVGIVLFPLLGIMDYYATPENFARFALYRTVITLLLAVLFILNRQKTNLQYQHIIILSGIFLSACSIELMIFAHGGHQSTYYAGLNLVIIAVLGFIPIDFAVALFSVLIVYAVYLLPLLLFDKITDMPHFIENNAFLMATSTIALAWRLLSQQRLLNELSLQYDLDRERNNLIGYSAQLEDLVSERTKELHKSEQWHRLLFENSNDGIVVVDRNGIIVNANEKACEMHGFERATLIGTHIKLLSAADDREKSAERMNRLMNGDSLVFESMHNKKDGTPIYLEISSKGIIIDNELFIHSVYRDITEKKKLQEHLFQSQKMDSIGVLAGGIAHDFNNILTAILGHTDIVRRTAQLSDKATQSLGVIEDASRRANRMIAKLLGFARKSKLDIVPLKLNDVVYDTIKLVERLIDKNIEMSIELDSHLPFVEGDTNHIEQIVLNLIVNARDAMPKGGKINIKTSVIRVEPGMHNVPNYILSGDYVLLSVTDTGSGIPENILNKIFEPFFTTKERGKGTGLGLSMVYGAVKDHKGYITVASEVGRGTTFSIYLPAVTMEEIASRRQSLTPEGGSETLLVVDDDELILKSMNITLSDAGYKVFAMNDSISALNIFKKLPQEIQLVITDISMPKMDGRELIDQMKAVKPEVKIIAISGKMKHIADKDGIREIDGFMKKPFDAPYLLSVVRRILDMKTKTSPLYS